jgi:hypothetical protein
VIAGTVAAVALFALIRWNKPGVLSESIDERARRAVLRPALPRRMRQIDREPGPLHTYEGRSQGHGAPGR